jgi:hypothetical protein
LKEWPWVDVYMSRSTPDILLSTLTAGMIGVGDPMGEFDKTNLSLAARTDGVDVKPDRPITPIDKTFIADAKNKSEPIIAATYSQQGDYKTAYVFVYPQKPEVPDYSFTAADIGMSGDVMVYDWRSKNGKRLSAGEKFSGLFDSSASTRPGNPAWAYFIVAPISKSGVAMLGDEGKFASMGKQRVTAVQDTPESLKLTISFAAGEETVALHGFDKKGEYFRREYARPSNQDTATIEFTAK